MGFNPYLAFGWSTLAGFMMAMGAGGGGIMAGIGHISVLGIADANTIKVLNQILEFSSRLVSVPLYHRQRRMVWPLAISYGVGAPLGAVLGSWLSKMHLSDMSLYRPVFGALVLAVAARVLYESRSKAADRNARLKKARDASERARQAIKPGTSNAAPDPPYGDGPSLVKFAWCKVIVGFGGEDFAFNPLVAALGGLFIGFTGSAIGVGGGFLVTPFMASVLLFPMFLVVGTGLVAIMAPLVASVVTYLFLDVHVNWWLVAVEVPGVIIGSSIAPILNKRMRENSFRRFVAAVLLGIGVWYLA